MGLRLARHQFYPIHIPYARPIRWAGHMESGVDVLLLALETVEGIRGIGETPIRLRWHAATPKSLMTVIEEVFLPEMRNLDLEDEQKVGNFLADQAEHPLAKSLIDTACWDLRAQAAGEPLWQRLGVSNPKVPISWTVTRAAPQAMARDAKQAAERHGVRAFKVKTGQGFETDRAALSEIRRAVGDDAALFADSNSADALESVPAMSRMLADYGVALFEDPCRFVPNDAFRTLRRECALPILVDNGCRSVAQAGLFLDVGADALSVKVMKTGITESRTIGRMAQQRKAGVAVGISASSSIGAMTALALSASLPGDVRCAPCEETFFANMDDVLLQPLAFRDGSVELPATSGYALLIDWTKVKSLCAA